MMEVAAGRFQKNNNLKDDKNSIEFLSQKISVTVPYYALQDVHFEENNVLSAKFPIELKSHNEIDGISLAEAGRHMSILGALSLSEKMPTNEKHYYLATDAIIERSSNESFELDYCRGEVSSVLVNKKNGSCSGKLYSSTGKLIFTLELKYLIIPKELFERFYKNKRVETDKIFLGNPYAFPSRYCTDQINPVSCSAFIGKVRKEDCIGHFPDFPALPITRIGGAMVDLSGFHYNAIRMKNEKFCIKRLELHANSLIFTEEAVKYSTRINDKTKPGNIIIESYANTGTKENAVEMKCWFY